MNSKKKNRTGAFFKAVPAYVLILIAGFFITAVCSVFHVYKTEYILKQNAWHLARLYGGRLETILEDAAGRAELMRAAVQMSDGRITEDKFRQVMPGIDKEKTVISAFLIEENGEIYQSPKGVFSKEMLQKESAEEFDAIRKRAAQENRTVIDILPQFGQTGEVYMVTAPVFLKGEQGEELWGFSCVVLEPEKIKEETGWEDLKEKGYLYSLKPAQTGEETEDEEEREEVYYTVSMPEEDMNLCLTYEKGWKDWSGGLLILVLGMAATSVLAYICHISEERRQLLDTMELEHEIFRISMEESGLTVFLYNQENKSIVFQNGGKPGVCRGNRLENIPDQFVERISDQSMRKKFLAMFKEIEEGKRNASCFLKSQSEQGIRWERLMLVNPFPEKYENRKVIGIIRDITAEKEIELDDEILRLSADYSGLTVFIYNKETGDLTFKNKGGWNCELPDKAACNLENAARYCICRESREEFLRTFEEISETVREVSCTVAALSSGEERWKKITLINPFSRQNGIKQIVGIVEDITEERRKEHQFLKEKAYMEAMIGQSVFHLETNVTRNRLLSYNRIPVPEGENILYENFIREHVIQVVYEDDAELVSDVLSCKKLREQFYSEKNNQFSIEYRRRTGEGYSWCIANVYLTEIPETHELNAVIVSHNNEEKKKKELELLYKAERDPLTGLYNRAACERYVNANLSIGHQDIKSAFLLIDLDNFKEINDTMGHIQGDAVLKDVAGILKRSFRKTDVVGRLGGDEFIVFMRDIKSEENVKASAGKLTQLLKVTYEKGDMKVSISGSVGIAMAPECGRKFKQLYDCADQALYSVKYTKKGGFSFAETGEKGECGERKETGDISDIKR